MSLLFRVLLKLSSYSSSILLDDCRLHICEALMTLELPPNVVFHDLLSVLKDCRGSSSKLVVGVVFSDHFCHSLICFGAIGSCLLPSISI